MQGLPPSLDPKAIGLVTFQYDAAIWLEGPTSLSTCIDSFPGGAAKCPGLQSLRANIAGSLDARRLPSCKPLPESKVLQPLPAQRQLIQHPIFSSGTIAGLAR